MKALACLVLFLIAIPDGKATGPSCTSLFFTPKTNSEEQIESIDLAKKTFTYRFSVVLVHRGMLYFDGFSLHSLKKKLSERFEILNANESCLPGPCTDFSRLLLIAFENASQHGRKENPGAAKVKWGVSYDGQNQLSVSITNHVFAPLPEKLLNYKEGEGIPSFYESDRDVARGGYGKGMNLMDNYRRVLGAKLNWIFNEQEQLLTFIVKVKVRDNLER